MRVARKAGRDAANTAIVSRAAGAAANVTGSNAGMPYKNDAIKRDNMTETPSPSTIPMPVSRKQCPTTKLTTLAPLAPSAMRMPISDVRCVTQYDTKP